jgi:hypothetical protein
MPKFSEIKVKKILSNDNEWKDVDGFKWRSWKTKDGFRWTTNKDLGGLFACTDRRGADKYCIDNCTDGQQVYQILHTVRIDTDFRYSKTPEQRCWFGADPEIVLEFIQTEHTRFGVYEILMDSKRGKVFFDIDGGSIDNPKIGMEAIREILPEGKFCYIRE